MAGSVEIEGHRELRRKINRITDDVDKQNAKGELKAMNLAAAEIVENRATELVPVRTGTLRDTIRAAGTQKYGRVRAGFARVPYAGPIHFGWAARNIRPNPFLYNALDDRRVEVFRSYEKQMSDLIRRRRL